MTTLRTGAHRPSLTSDVVGRGIRAFLDERAPASGRARRARAIPELVEAGWQTFDGSLTISGARLREDLATRPATLHITSQDAWTSRQGWIRVGATRALAVVQVPGTPVSVEVMPSGALPIHLAAWGGLEPTLTTGETFVVGDADAVMRRVWDTAEALPAGSDPRLAELWARPWRHWSVAREGADTELSLVAVRDAGHFVVRRDPQGRPLLAQRPGSLLWGDIQAVVAALPSAADALDPDDASDW